MDLNFVSNNILLIKGYASTCFQVKNATPRQGIVSGATRGSIRILKEIFGNPQHSLENLDQFSHCWYFKYIPLHTPFFDGFYKL